MLLWTWTSDLSRMAPSPREEGIKSDVRVSECTLIWGEVGVNYSTQIWSPSTHWHFRVGWGGCYTSLFKSEIQAHTEMSSFFIHWTSKLSGSYCCESMLNPRSGVPRLNLHLMLVVDAKAWCMPKVCFISQWNETDDPLWYYFQAVD